MNTYPRHTQPSFEDVYPKAPFAELIRLSVLLAERIVKLRARLTGSQAAAAQIGQPAGN